MLSILDRYVLKQVLVPLGASLAIGLAMLLAERLVRLLDTTLGKKNSFGVVFELLAYLVPHYLGTAVPAALFLGLLFGFNKLSKSQELDAMMAAGVGLHRIARPVFMLAVLFSIVSLVTYGWIQPLTRYAYRSVLFDVKNVDAFYLAEEGVFMQSGSRTFILDKLNRDTNTFEHVFLFDYRGPNGAETMTAANGLLIPVPGQRPVLRLNTGHRLLVERWPTLAPAAAPVTASIAEFETTDTPLGRVSKDLFRPRGQDTREMTLPELIASFRAPPKGITADEMHAELNRRIVNIAAMLLLPFLALPFSLGRARSPRAYRTAFAFVLLVAFHEIIEQGALATKASGISPVLTMWTPLAALTVFGIWRFYRTCFRLTDNSFDDWILPLQEQLLAIWRWLKRGFSLRRTT